MTNKKYYGTGVALITPFNEDLSVDFASLEKLLEYVNKGGVDYYVILGTTGESSTVTEKEKTEIIAFIKKNNPKKLPIVLGHGGNDTSKLIESYNTINFDGIDGILTVNPYYNKPSQEGLYQHFKAVSDASPVDVILYNIPGRTGVNMLAETTLRLASHPKVVGIKEASGDLAQCIDIVKQKPSDFLLIGGDDILTLPMISVGGVGAISAISNAFPDITSKMTNFALANDYASANVELHKFCHLNKLFFEEGNPVGVKIMLDILGICKPFVRLPLVKASDGLRTKMKSLIEKA
ncbi:MAG: 4-hydroxy-tetrahydrodipicolinate synthase [Bacteroidetes bacterium]|nr:MAG: 4-hydroxy-tetrahydrodipicolinate synthase [Bacteroidota bacterium]